MKTGSTKSGKILMFNIAVHAMKKVVMVLITAIFIFTLLASCNKNVCPAYVLDPPPAQTDNNG
jgi:hypothetical protein